MESGEGVVEQELCGGRLTDGDYEDELCNESFSEGKCGRGGGKAKRGRGDDINLSTQYFTWKVPFVASHVCFW